MRFEHFHAEFGFSDPENFGNDILEPIKAQNWISVGMQRKKLLKSLKKWPKEPKRNENIRSKYVSAEKIVYSCNCVKYICQWMCEIYAKKKISLNRG